MEKANIKVGIVGHGNLGRGVEKGILQNPDMELCAIFTRRDPAAIQALEKTTLVLPTREALNFASKIDVMILCGGSATDLPQQSPHFARLFNIIDSYDNHAKIPEHYAAVNEAALAGGKAAVISAGWDPGLFSIFRMMSGAILPQGADYTFWGKGVSQGHSDALRRVDGVKNAIQYTIPIEESVEKARSGEEPALTTREKHIRECFVVPEAGADRERIIQEIKTMPNYFADYETNVTFITDEELARDHTRMPHGGYVIRSGRTGAAPSLHKQVMEFSLKLESNPEFTASVLVAYARAVYRLNREGIVGAKTVFDIPLGYLSISTLEELRRKLL